MLKRKEQLIRKKEKFRLLLGLTVDKEKHRFGNSNDGNTGQRQRR